MSDSKQNENETMDIDAQLTAAICTVLKYELILPADFGSVWDDDAVRKLSDEIKRVICVWSKDNPGARLVYNAASQLPDGLEIPLF